MVDEKKNLCWIYNETGNDIYYCGSMGSTEEDEGKVHCTHYEKAEDTVSECVHAYGFRCKSRAAVLDVLADRTMEEL